jgi:hypothetical protein
MESILKNLPEGNLIGDYFCTLNIFEKRQLLNELEDIKSSMEKRLSLCKKLMVFVLFLSAFGYVSSYPSLFYGIYYTCLNAYLLFIFYKFTKRTENFQFLIDYLTFKL